MTESEGTNMSEPANDRAVIPNTAIDASIDRVVDPDAPLVPDDLDERREAMKAFDGKAPAVSLPIPDPAALASDPEARRETAREAVTASSEPPADASGA
jgi:hypothetical protein